MATPTSEDEIKVLREQNTELVQKVQHWKMLAAQRENEKLDLMRELNEMRLKLARLRSNGDLQASKLDTALQSASEKALAHLVRASGEIARTIDLAKTYMRERNETDTVSPRWSAIGGTPKTEKVHRVPPMMIGGQSIQPVVSLSRTLLNTSNPRPTARSPNRNVTERAVPMHMLQDVYIPLTRIDAGELQAQSMETEAEANNSEESTEGLELDESGDRSDVEESQRMSDDEYNASRRLDAVAEDMEPEDEVETPSRNSRTENPLEGPSWLLDAINTSSCKSTAAARSNLEPDSTTEVEEAQAATTPINVNTRDEDEEGSDARISLAYSPTVRRRKRPSSPCSPAPAAPAPAPAGPAPAAAATPRRHSQYSPRPHQRRNSNSGRVLKVMVAKMRLEAGPAGSPGAPLRPEAGPAGCPGAPRRLEAGSPAPPKRLATLELLDAPSPNGATVQGVIVSETQDLEQGGSGEPHGTRRGGRSQREACVSRQRDTLDETDDRRERDSRGNNSRRQNHSRYGSSSQDSRDSDSGAELQPAGRARRPRTHVPNYQERSLTRKLRRN